MKLQSTSWFDPSTAKKVGKLVGAEAVVIGTVTPKKQYAEAQIRVVNRKLCHEIIVQNFHDFLVL